MQKASGDGKIPGNMSEHAYENVKHENIYENDVYENVKLEVSRRPRAPTPPKVSSFIIFKSHRSSYVCFGCIIK